MLIYINVIVMQLTGLPTKEIIAIKPIHSVAENVICMGDFPTKYLDACWVVCSHTIGTKAKFLG